jgi:hypothetical protein
MVDSSFQFESNAKREEVGIVVSPSLDKVTDVAARPLTAPPGVEFRDVVDRPFGCEGADAVSHYEGVISEHIKTWEALQPIVEGVQVLHPGVFDTRDENGLPVFCPFALEGAGIESIIVPSHGNIKFSAGFVGLESHYSDIRTLIRRLGTERYDGEHTNPIKETIKETISKIDREWGYLKLRPFVLAACISTILAACGIALPVFGIAGTLWMYIVGALSFVVAIGCACVAVISQRQIVDTRWNRILRLLSDATHRPELDCSVSWAFQGGVPTAVRGMIRDYLDKGYFDRIVLLAEVPCQVEYSIVPQPIRVDPLIVGFRKGDDRAFLLGKFDLTSREATAADEAEFFASGIKWDEMV